MSIGSIGHTKCPLDILAILLPAGEITTGYGWYFQPTYMKYILDRTPCGNESGNDAEALCPLDPVDPMDIQMSIGNLRCPMDPMDIQMSIGNVMCPMDPMDMWKISNGHLTGQIYTYEIAT